MTDNPFASIKPPAVITPESDEREVDPETTPVIPCKHCQQPVQRAVDSGKWVHSDDEWVIRGTKVISHGKYDHKAEPAWIETTAKET